MQTWLFYVIVAKYGADRTERAMRLMNWLNYVILITAEGGKKF